MELDFYFETFWIFILSIGTFALSSIVGAVSTYKLFHKPKEKKQAEPEKVVCPECGGVDGFHKSLCTLKGEVKAVVQAPKRPVWHCPDCGTSSTHKKNCPRNKEKKQIAENQT